jgi:GNAT superfamily N-acetyltransferase
VVSFPAFVVVAADVEPDWAIDLLPPDDLAGPLCPPFLTALCAKTGRVAGNIDMLMLAPRDPGPADIALRPVADLDHRRVRRARQFRDELTVYEADGGVLIIGRGLAGRWEAAIEVDEDARNRGLGRALAAAARTVVPEDRPIWAQVAPGNASSLRAFLAAGYRPVGAETLLVL